MALYRLWLTSIPGRLWTCFVHVLWAPLLNPLCSMTVNGAQAVSWSEALPERVNSQMTSHSFPQEVPLLLMENWPCYTSHFLELRQQKAKIGWGFINSPSSFYKTRIGTCASANHLLLACGDAGRGEQQGLCLQLASQRLSASPLPGCSLLGWLGLNVPHGQGVSVLQLI